MEVEPTLTHIHKQQIIEVFQSAISQQTQLVLSNLDQTDLSQVEVNYLINCSPQDQVF